MWVNLAALHTLCIMPGLLALLHAVTTGAGVTLMTSHPDGIAGAGLWLSPCPRRVMGQRCCCQLALQLLLCIFRRL